MSKTHELKTWPECFQAIKRGQKTFDIRENDRNFQVGDILVLREFKPCKFCNGAGTYRDYTDIETCSCMESKYPQGKYTGRSLKRKVIYILDKFGLKENFICMAIVPVKKPSYPQKNSAEYKLARAQLKRLFKLVSKDQKSPTKDELQAL
jgi:hypothetical protein